MPRKIVIFSRESGNIARKTGVYNNTRGFEYDIDAATVKKVHFKRYPLVSRVTTG